MKPEAFGLFMATEKREDWGSTEHHYIISGHIHHQVVKEYTGYTMETFNTLAGHDAWHTKKGYRSKRNIKLLTHHIEYGEYGRLVVDIKKIRAEQSR